MTPSPKPRKRTKSSKSKLNKEADKLWSLAVRKPGYCLKCKRRPPQVQLHAAHIYPKGKYRNHPLRCDLLNGIPLCYSCHLHWAHKHPLEFNDWLELEIPGRKEYLKAESMVVKKFNAVEAIRLLTEAV